MKVIKYIISNNENCLTLTFKVLSKLLSILEKK